MTEYPTHTWPRVVESFRSFAEGNPYFAPMSAFVERLATSPYAVGLFPVQSMHSVRLYQHERFSWYLDEIRVDFHEGEFIVRYFSGGGFRSLEPKPAEGVWMKRSFDGFAALERCLHHVRWFVEYTGALDPSASAPPSYSATSERLSSLVPDEAPAMKVLVFGATGSAGGSVLRACLSSPAVEEVRAVVRRPLTLAHEKLRVFVTGDFLDYAPVVEAFARVDACFFCLGISATQVSGEAEYRRITHDYALAAARMLRTHSPDAAFHFISGQGTSLGSRMMWARVKAETEQELIDQVGAVCWRPAFIDGADSGSGPWLYQAIRPVFRLLRPFRGLYVAGEDIGLAMIQATHEHQRGRVIENPEIRSIADRARGIPGPT